MVFFVGCILSLLCLAIGSVKVLNTLETIGKTSYTFQSNFQEKSAFLRIHWIVNYFKISPILANMKNEKGGKV